MFGKIVVIAVLVTLVKNASLRVVEDEPRLMSEGNKSNANYRNSIESPKVDQRKIIPHLNCSDLEKNSLGEDVIELRDAVVLKMSNPCIINAPVIILRNNHFPSYKHAFNITGKKIVMDNNLFYGPEQNHYIVGDNVLLVNNTYQGHFQIHEVAGYEVTAFYNVYDGRGRVNQYAGTSILVFDNESKGSLFDVILSDNSPNFMHRLYPNDLSNYETGAFNHIREHTEYSLGKISPETFDITPRNVTRFLQDVKFGSKINRPANANIIKKFEGLIDDRFSLF